MKRPGIIISITTTLCITAMLCAHVAMAQEQISASDPTVQQDQQETGDSGVQQNGESSGESVTDSAGESTEGLVNLLTEESFQVGDVPEEYLQPAQHQGTVERVRYEMPGDDSGRTVKSVMIYLPYGYDETDDRQYNILYLLHPSGGTPSDYFSKGKITELQCLLDHMTEDGLIEPLIVAAPTYFTDDPFIQYMPLGLQVGEISDFPAELTEYIIPAVESSYHTFTQSADKEGITASRDHRAVAGFSLGGTATWNAFIQTMFAFRWFLPISEASWDDGEGGIKGIWDSDLSAEVIYNAVINQGYTADDFVLFVATGTEDVAFEIATEQMKSLLEYSDLFITGENTSCSMMIDGAHTKSAIYTYLYHILPALFT